jgi:hypothetical protein
MAILRVSELRTDWQRYRLFAGGTVVADMPSTYDRRSRKCPYLGIYGQSRYEQSTLHR